jgi:2,3-bisphosphoglycerate-independent phosphoglycerate mutase
MSENATKYIMLISDGMADRALPELDGRTPMQVAKKRNMDYIAANGRVGAVRTIPPGMDPGSDVAAMSLLGYDPRKYYTGRAPIEAASMQIPLEKHDVAFRCNLVSCDGVNMVDYSGGHVSTEEARELITYIGERLGSRTLNFYSGISYRHIMVWRDGSPDVMTTPPHNITGRPIAEFLPEGDNDDKLRTLMFDSLELLDNHPINRRRREAGKHPANMIWLWGQGLSLNIPSFFSKTGKTGSVIAAVDLVRGLGIAAGFNAPIIPGATGYLDTNFEGKAQHALAALKTHDLVVVHVEAPDEAGHNGDIEAKIKAIEDIDRRTLGVLLDGLKATPKFRIMVTPDHATPICIKTHADEPIPFAIYSSFEPAGTNIPFDERAVEETKLRVDEGFRLIDLLLS